MYNLTQINGSGIVPLISSTDDVLLYNWYGNLILIGLILIFYLNFVKRTDSPKQSITASSLIVAISASIFLSLGFITSTVLIICWVIVAIAGGLMFLIPE